jgi:hypothetical protein
VAKRSIRDLQKKIRCLRDSVVAQRVGGYSGTNNGFGEATLGRSNLQSILERETSGLDVEHERTLSEVCKFRVDWPEWQTSAAEEFIKRYEREHRRCDVENAVQQRRLGLRLTSRTLDVQVPDEHNGLAQLDLSFQQAGPDEPWPVSFDLICKPAPTPKPGFQFGVKRGRFELHHGAAKISPSTKERLAGDGPVTFAARDDRERTITVEIANAKAGRPAWTVWSDHGPIGICRLDDAQVLCRIAEIAPGDEMVAIFKVYVGDLEPLGLDDDDDDDGDPDPYSFARADGKPLSPTKRQIIRQMLVKEEVGIPADGWVVVASDGRLFEEDKADGA